MVVKNISKDVYKKIIEYALKKSDFFTLSKYNDPYFLRTQKIFKFLVLDDKFSKQQILFNDFQSLLNKLYEIYKYNKYIYEIELKQQLHNYNNEIHYFKSSNNLNYDYNESLKKYKSRFNSKNNILLKLQNNETDFEIFNSKDIFSWVIYWIRYDYNTNIFIKKYENSVIKKRKIYCNFPMRFNDLYKTIYTFKIDDEMKLLLTSEFDDIYDWVRPNRLEDLCFYKNNVCWIYTVSHEKICDIYCENEEEYNYLKSIGVEFYEDHYIPEKPILENEV